MVVIARCGCAGFTGCACLVTVSGALSISGSGGATDQYVIEGPTLQADPTSELDVSITGAGSSASPWLISVESPVGATEYAAQSISGTASRAATVDTSLDLTLTANADFTITGSTLGVIVGIRVNPSTFTLTLPGGLVVSGDPTTVTAWRMAEGWIYSVAGAATVVPDPGDTTPPTAGTLASSAITDSGFTLTVTGASDDSALHPTPYSFSIDGGATWSAWQSSSVYTVTGRPASTAHSCRHQVRDNADPPHEVLGTAITVTTSAVAGVLTFRGEDRTASSSVDTFTYAGVDIGAASAGRYVIAAVNWWSSGQRDCSLTINGVSATSVWAPVTMGANGGVRYFLLNVPTGTTATLVATSTSGGFFLSPSIAVWTTNQLVTVNTGTHNVVAAGETTTTVTTASVAGGFALAGFRSRSGAFSTTWSGPTERWDFTGSQPTSGGDMVTAGTSAAATPTFSVALDQSTTVSIVAFRWGA